MHAKMDDRGGLAIVVTNYHDGEYPFTADGAFVRRVWDIGQLSLLEYIEHQKTGKHPLTLDSMESIATFNGFLEAELAHYGIEPYNPHDLVGQTIYVVSGSPVAVFKAFAEYALMLEEDVRNGGPGADDGTYDYFPGAVEALMQLAMGFIEVADKDFADAARIVYNQVVDAARDTHYKDNEEADDLLPRLS